MAHDRLLDIAIREFGSKGLEGVSTRELATAAGTAMSAITYHYGGKEGLYLAAADHLAVRMSEEMGAVLRAAPPSLDGAEARRRLQELLVHFLTRCVLAEEADWSLFIMREQMQPTGAFDRLYDGSMGPMAERMATLVMEATGAPGVEARIAALLLFGQAIVWRTARALAERSLGRPARDAIQPICRNMAANVDAILDRLAAEQQESR